MAAELEVETRNNPELSRFEILADGELAGWVDYRPAGESTIIAHTEIRPEFERRGLASRITEDTLAWIRDDGRTVIPSCAYAAAYIHRHPEWVDHVIPALQPQFRR